MPKCEYGCGLEAKFQITKNKKWCCSESYNSCPKIRMKFSEGQKKKEKHKQIENPEHKLCEYGCGLEAQYQFRNKKWCCSEDTNNCPNVISKITKANKGKTPTEETRNKISETLTGRPLSEETKRKLSKSMKGKNTGPRGPLSEERKNNIGNAVRYSLKDYQVKHPFFFKVEELREDPITGKFQAHCKNNKCKNSKEKGGWFTLYGRQLELRIAELEHPSGNGGGYFYCCDKCKQECSLFNIHGDPLSTPTKLPYTPEEYETFRQEVLKRDNYICQMCEKKPSVHVHHTRPKKLEPFFALDPDYGFSVCEDCHKFIHRAADKGGSCSYGELANKICNQEE